MLLDLVRWNNRTGEGWWEEGGDWAGCPECEPIVSCRVVATGSSYQARGGRRYLSVSIYPSLSVRPCLLVALSASGCSSLSVRLCPPASVCPPLPVRLCLSVSVCCFCPPVRFCLCLSARLYFPSPSVRFCLLASVRPSLSVRLCLLAPVCPSRSVRFFLFGSVRPSRGLPVSVWRSSPCLSVRPRLLLPPSPSPSRWRWPRWQWC